MRLTVLQEIKRYEGSRYRVYCVCVCTCGTEVTVRKDRLNGNTSSCGSCGLQRERASEANRTHGLSQSPEYDVYMGMKSRCYNQQDPAYKNYGGCGIKICERWLGPDGFINFYADMKPRPSPELTIERRNSKGNYEPSNCKWATRKEQNRNINRNRLIPYQSRIQCLAAWVEELGIDRNRFYFLLRKGYSETEALDLQVKDSGR